MKPDNQELERRFRELIEVAYVTGRSLGELELQARTLSSEDYARWVESLSHTGRLLSPE